jgi:hypothetical protein
MGKDGERLKENSSRCHKIWPAALAACLCSRDVASDFFEIGADHSANEAATTVVHVHLRNRVNIKLLHNSGSPIDDVNLPQRNIGIASRHFLQAR